jgi:CHAD domain-containing protein
MAYRFKETETVADGVRRIAADELTSAADELSRSTPKDRDGAIHKARKRVKKTRALLRLMQTELGDFFERDDQRLQKIGLELSDIRDAEAIVETFDQVAKQYEGNLPGRALHSIRTELDRRKRAKKKAARLGTALPRLAMSLRSMAKEVREWSLRRDGFDALEPGLVRTLKRGRKAMKVAQKHPEPDNLHDWRKRTKDHWYHLRLLENIWTEVMEARESSLKRLETWLGDDHTLTVLCKQISDDREKFGTAGDVDLFLTLASKKQDELRKKALSLGRRIYGEKPNTMTARLSQLWEAWQARPLEMKVERKKPAASGRKAAKTAA